MGDFDQSAHDPAPPPAREQPSALLPPAEVPELPPWSVRARTPLTEEKVLAEVGPGTLESGRVMALHRTMQTRARLYSHHLRLLAAFFLEDPEVQGRPDDADLSALKIAAGLRCTYGQAWSQVRDARTAVEIMPLTFEYLRRGELTEAMHRTLLRRVRRLTDAQAAQVDGHMASLELPSISVDAFTRHLRLAVELATAGELPAPPAQSRAVEIVDVDPSAGTASLLVTGPMLEITGLAHRLDAAARDVQRAQRAALADGAEGPLPFDLDEDLAERGRPLSLATLRYAILTHSVLDIDPVQETATPYKLLVTVPVTTLLGEDDAPAMLEGTTPVPAELARELAAVSTVWYRILTDPVCGSILPVRIDTYRPDAQQRMQLRLRHPVCAVPGCTRSTALGAEDDHIHEYDHAHPDRGGPTSLENLHRLCWHHHRMKTAGLIDPTRERIDPAAPACPLTTQWALGRDLRTATEDATDLLTPRAARLLEHAWSEHQRRRSENGNRRIIPPESPPPPHGGHPPF